MPLSEILESFLTDDQAKCIYAQRHVTFAETRRDRYRLYTDTSPEFRTSKGKLIAFLLRGVFSAEEQAKRNATWSQVKDNLRNRPSVFTREARLPLLRNDGNPTGREGVPKAITDLTGGKTGLLGFNRSPACEPHYGLSSWSLQRPDLYEAVKLDAQRVSQLFAAALPQEYVEQLAGLARVPGDLRIPDSVFTSVYGIANHPTACHQDKANLKQSTGILTTTGQFEGNQFILPEFKLGFDLQPDAVLFADVHRWHGNLPKLSGSRCAQIYYIKDRLKRRD